MLTTLDYALAYLHRGWSVIPLEPGTKRPATALAPYLSGEARMTADDARRWWSTGDYGIGIVTGKPSGIVVIDIDPRNGGDLAIANMVGTDLVQTTGGGGLHVVCAYPGEPTPCGKTREPGVDRKGDGGYIVAAPSIHPNGHAYRWRNELSRTFADGTGSAWLLGDPAPLPAWVTERRQSGESSLADTPSEPWIASTLAHPERVQPGSQEETLTRLCWWAARHLPHDIGLGLLQGWAARLPLGNPHDPWTEQHVASRLERAAEKREPDPGYVSGIVGEEPAPKVAALREKVRSAPAFVAQAETDAAGREWIAPDFLAPGCWTELIGVMKEGKTTFACGLLKAVTTGGEYLGRTCQATSVLYVTEQVGLSFQRTLERGALLESENLYVLTIADLFGLRWSEASTAIVDIAAELGCKVIVIDTLARLSGMVDEDEAKSVTVLNPLLKARALGIAVLFVRHSRKAGGAINVAARGTGAITGEMDICLYITAPQGVASDYRRLEGVSRLTDTIEEHLEYDGGTYIVGTDPAEAKREAAVAPVVQHLSAQGMAWTPGPAVVEAVKGARSKAQVYKDLKALLADGTIEQSDAGYRIRPTGASGVTT